MNKIRKGDEVIVLAGRDKKRRGTVLEMVGEDRVLVEGVNVVKKHARPNPSLGTAGGIVEKTLPIHISNVAVFNSASGKGERVSIKVEQVEGKRKAVRVFRSSGAVVGAKA